MNDREAKAREDGYTAGRRTALLGQLRHILGELAGDGASLPGEAQLVAEREEAVLLLRRECAERGCRQGRAGPKDASAVTRRDRRAQAARGGVRNVNVRCGVCRAVLLTLTEGEAFTGHLRLRPGVQACADAAQRSHYAVTGCVKPEDVLPVDLLALVR